MNRVVVTGLGIISCIGNTKSEVANNLKNLNSGIIKAPEYEEFGFRSLVHGKPEISLDNFERVFQGWMISSSPTVTPFEHPTYDVWVKDCKIEIDSE